MPEFNREIADKLSWGILLHMQGRRSESADYLRAAKKIEQDLPASEGAEAGGASALCDAILDYAKLGPKESILEKVDRLLRCKDLGYRFASEPDIAKPGAAPVEGPDSGLSRDPFVGVGYENSATGMQLRSALAVAATLYLLRGYLSFFSKPKNEREFNAAKVTLNDLFQCGQLGWRLYRGLSSCHAIHGHQRKYFEEILQSQELGSAPGSSPYFIWSLLQLVEIQRGNTYRQIDHLDEAARAYRHFHQRLERLEGHGKTAFLATKQEDLLTEWKSFVTPTTIRAYSEISKVQFDQGYFLESLMSQVKAMAYLVQSGQSGNWVKGAADVIQDSVRVNQLLEAENRQQVFDLSLILKEFGRPVAGSISNPHAIVPSRFRDLVPDKSLKLAADLLARMGFTLLTLQGKPEGKIGKGTEWLHQFAQAHRSLTGKPTVRSSYHASYLACLLGLKDEGKNTSKSQSMEQRFLVHLRRARSDSRLGSGSYDSSDLYSKILQSTTENLVNLATIPRRVQKHFMRRGYRWRCQHGDLSKDELRARHRPTDGLQDRPRDKIVVLRRWQSIAPRMPRPGSDRLRGGGYFLIWKGKGIVVDPGYDFVQNFYEEGFSLDDIDAVVVTHSHADHDNDLSTLTSLCKEWADYEQLGGGTKSPRGIDSIDFVLNESAALKFSAWLKSSRVKIGRLITMSSAWWDKDSEVPWEPRIRGGTASIDLLKEYSLTIEVIPAWHDDVISRTEAVGLKLHLYEAPKTNEEDTQELLGRIGITGDTGAYGYDLAGRGNNHPPRIEAFYGDCDVLIAHLGDVRIRELTTAIGTWGRNHPLWQRFRELFPAEQMRTPAGPKLLTSEVVSDFLCSLGALHLIPGEIFKQRINIPGIGAITACRFLLSRPTVESSTRHLNKGPDRSELIRAILAAADSVFDNMGFAGDSQTRIEYRNLINTEISSGTECFDLHVPVDDVRVRWSLLVFICAMGSVPWQYPYHLGIHGLHRLFLKMIEAQGEKEDKRGGVFVVGELPEELASYRHLVAWHLNELGKNRCGDGLTERKVHACTGDIGLHISLDESESGHIHPKIRCTYCNYNNEAVMSGSNYAAPSDIREVPLKRLDSAMIYLCRKHGFGGHDIVEDRFFLSRPNLRVI